MNPDSTAPVPVAAGTGATNTHMEGPTMPDSTEARTGAHRPVSLVYSTQHVSVVPDPIAERPSVLASINTSTLQVSATLTAGPLRLRFPDAETARFWASAMEELAAQLAIAEGQAADLRNTAMADAGRLGQRGDGWFEIDQDDDLADVQAAEHASDASDYDDHGRDEA